MPLSNSDQLVAAIDATVPSHGGPLLTSAGKVTSTGLNNLLKTMAAGLIPTDSGGSSAGTPLLALSYNELLVRLGDATLVPGQQYLVTDRPNPALGGSGEILIQAAAADALSPTAILCAHVPDYAGTPIWRSNYLDQGAVIGTTYQQIDSPFVPLTPDELDFVDYSLEGDDNLSIAQLPFPFTYGGVPYTQVGVDTNGRLILDPAHFSSEYEQHPLAPGYASVYLCWGDLFASQSTIRYFVTGQAPYRKFVVDYTNIIPQTSITNNYFHYSGLCSGQIILEETTNAVTLGISACTLTETNWVQGLQYPQQAYQPNKDAVLSSGLQHRFTPLTNRAPIAPALASGSPVCWLGQTWELASNGSSNDEPGTTGSWVLATTAGADSFGNSLRTYDTVRYEPLSDLISERRDSRHNLVVDSSLATFPWGNPGVSNNYLRAVTLDSSLLYVDRLQFTANSLVNVRFQNVNLTGISFTGNQLTEVTLSDYAPTAFEHVTAVQGLDLAYTHCVGQQFLGGQLQQNAEIIAGGLIRNLLLKQSQLDCVVYKAGQPVSYRTPDFLHPVGSVIPDHDRIDLVGGNWSDKTLWLRNFDFTINGHDIAVSNVALGRGSTGQQTSITGLRVTDYLDLHTANPTDSTNVPNLNPHASATAGMNITLTRCTINRLALATGPSPAGFDKNYYAIDYCVIRRVEQMAAAAGTAHRLNHCVFGQGLTTGSVFGGAGPDNSGALVIANSVIYLGDSVTLFDGATPPQCPPTFQNVTVVAANGTVSRLDTVLPNRDPFAVQDNASVVAAVTGGTYSSGELQSTSANYAVATDATVVKAGDELTDAGFSYRYQRVASGGYGWVRYSKS